MLYSRTFEVVNGQLIVQQIRPTKVVDPAIAPDDCCRRQRRAEVVEIKFL